MFLGHPVLNLLPAKTACRPPIPFSARTTFAKMPPPTNLSPSRNLRAQLIQSAAALAMLLDENKDEQILKEACLGLCQLFGDGIQNDRIQAILEADVVPRLVALLKPTRTRNVPVSVQAAALQVIGNVACGDDRQTQVIIDCEALPCLKVCLFVRVYVLGCV